MKKTEAIPTIKHVTATFQFLTDKYFQSLDWTMEENGFKSIKWGGGWRRKNKSAKVHGLECVS